MAEEITAGGLPRSLAADRSGFGVDVEFRGAGFRALELYFVVVG